MPYICISTPTKMTKEQKVDLKTKIGENIPLIEGKVEARLIVKIDDESDMYFGGIQKDEIAFVEIKLYTEAEFEQKKKFVESMFVVLKDILSIEKESVFMNLSEYMQWGMQGSFFKAE